MRKMKKILIYLGYDGIHIFASKNERATTRVAVDNEWKRKKKKVIEREQDHHRSAQIE